MSPMTGRQLQEQINDTINFSDPNRRAGTVQLPPGDFEIGEPLVIPPCSNLRFRGAGDHSTYLNWVGSDPRPMLIVNDFQNILFSDFAMTADRPGSTALLLNRSGYPEFRNRGSISRISAVRICGGIDFQNGIRIHGGVGPIPDSLIMSNCQISNYSDIGLFLPGNNKAERFQADVFDSTFSGGDIGKRGIHTASSLNVQRSSFTRHTEADVTIFGRGSAHLNGVFHSSARAIVVGGVMTTDNGDITISHADIWGCHGRDGSDMHGVTPVAAISVGGGVGRRVTIVGGSIGHEGDNLCIAVDGTNIRFVCERVLFGGWGSWESISDRFLLNSSAIADIRNLTAADQHGIFHPVPTASPVPVD